MCVYSLYTLFFFVVFIHLLFRRQFVCIDPLWFDPLAHDGTHAKSAFFLYEIFAHKFQCSHISAVLFLNFARVQWLSRVWNGPTLKFNPSLWPVSMSQVSFVPSIYLCCLWTYMYVYISIHVVPFFFYPLISSVIFHCLWAISRLRQCQPWTHGEHEVGGENRGLFFFKLFLPWHSSCYCPCLSSKDMELYTALFFI